MQTLVGILSGIALLVWGTHIVRSGVLRVLGGSLRQSIETSSLHLDIINDFKRINSHICSVAYPILEQAGALAPTRLREEFVNGTANQKHA